MAIKKKATKKKVAKKKKVRAATGSVLTSMQLLFAFEYPIDKNARLAAIRAGYSEEHADVKGSQLLRIPGVKQIIRESLNRQMKKAEINATWVLKEQVKVYKRCMQISQVFDKKGNPVMIDVDGVSKAAFTFDASGSNKALENVGKHIDVNAFKATDNDGVPIDQNWVVQVVHSTKESYDKAKDATPDTTG